MEDAGLALKRRTVRRPPVESSLASGAPAPAGSLPATRVGRRMGHAFIAAAVESPPRSVGRSANKEASRWSSPSWS